MAVTATGAGAMEMVAVAMEMEVAGKAGEATVMVEEAKEEGAMGRVAAATEGAGGMRKWDVIEGRLRRLIRRYYAC